MAAPATDIPYRAAAATTNTVATLGNAAAANRAAFWLGMLFPYFGIPIGLAFMMRNDRQCQDVGKLCILWSVVSSALHLLLMLVTFLGMRDYLSAFVGAAVSGAQRAGSGGFGGGMEGLP